MWWGLLLVVAPLVADHGPQSMQASVVARGLSSFSSWAQWLWRVGLVVLQHVGSSQIRIEPVSPALVGRLFTTEPPRKPGRRFRFSIETYNKESKTIQIKMGKHQRK